LRAPGDVSTIEDAGSVDEARAAGTRHGRPPPEPGGNTEYHGAECAECVKPLRWMSHALQALADRAIDRIEVEHTIAAPEFSVVDPPQWAVQMRRYLDGHLGRQMLLRVVI
jgi:hypothetical protein